MEHDLNDILVFRHVVEAGTFTAAGRALGLPTSSMSRRVTRLEERLGARLLQRTTRALSLTDAGRIYYEHVTRATEQLDEGSRAVGVLQSEPSGRLRLTAPTDIGRGLLPLIGAFLCENREVDIELELTNRIVNLVDEGYDCAVRAGTLPDSSLVARKLIEGSTFALFASPGYLQARGEPTTPADVEQHDCVAFGPMSTSGEWPLFGGAKQLRIRPKIRISVNDFGAVRAACVAGIGIGLLPTLIAGQDERAGLLVRVLPELVTATSSAVWLVYPSRSHLPVKVRAFADFLKAHFGEEFGAT